MDSPPSVAVLVALELPSSSSWAIGLRPSWLNRRVAALEVSRSDGVALLRLNRPEKRNALSIELRELLVEAMGALSADDDVRCAVFTGAGTAFCSGMDRGEFGGDRAHRERLAAASVDAFAAVGPVRQPPIRPPHRPGPAGGARPCP